MSMDIKHLAWLTRIKLSDDEAAKIKKRIEAAKKIVDRLLEAEVEHIEPLYHPQEGVAGYLRRDEATVSSDKCRERREKMLSNASRLEKGFIVAPRTVED